MHRDLVDRNTTLPDGVRVLDVVGIHVRAAADITTRIDVEHVRRSARAAW